MRNILQRNMIIYVVKNAYFLFRIVALKNLKKCFPIRMVTHAKSAVGSAFLTVLNVRSVGTGSIMNVLDCWKKILSPLVKMYIRIFSFGDVKCASIHFIR